MNSRLLKVAERLAEEKAAKEATEKIAKEVGRKMTASVTMPPPTPGSRASLFESSKTVTEASSSGQGV